MGDYEQQEFAKSLDDIAIHWSKWLNPKGSYYVPIFLTVQNKLYTLDESVVSFNQRLIFFLPTDHKFWKYSLHLVEENYIQLHNGLYIPYIVAEKNNLNYEHYFAKKMFAIDSGDLFFYSKN